MIPSSNNRRKIFLCLLLTLGIRLSLFPNDKYFYDVRQYRNSDDPGPELHFTIEDELLGYRPLADITVRSQRKIGGRTVYDAVYSLDRYGRRITPAPSPGKKEKFMLFFGCSFAFGEGVNDDETLPCYLARLMPGYAAYNYGYQGYGPQEMLAKLQNDAIASEVAEKRGMAFYLFIDTHINRAIGSLQITGNWGANMPYYVIAEDGSLERKGNFRSGRYALTALSGFLVRNPLTRKIIGQHDYPFIQERHIALTCRIIEESRNAFKTTFGGDDFYVVFYPSSGYVRKMIPYLEKAQIKYLDYSRADDLGRIPGDGHPTPPAYHALAGYIARDLSAVGRVVDLSER